MTQRVSVIFVNFTVIDTMSSALICINVVLVSRGQTIQCHEFCFLSRLRSIENSKAIIDRHTVIVSLFAEEKYKIEKKEKVNLLNSDHYAGGRYNTVFT